MKYKIVSIKFSGMRTDEYERLAEAVNNEIAVGWKPLGNPFIGKRRISQAMIQE
tara:strand:+ start:14366 stop:14527 length:162 start_codon:yes stop_codon:yes gene_type:complete